MTLFKFIKSIGLKKTYLAKSMKMEPATFNNKVRDGQKIYFFNDSEKKRLIEVLNKLKSNIEGFIAEYSK